MTKHASPANQAYIGRWLLVGADPCAVLQKLPQMDRIMLAIRQDDLLHERLGHIQSVSIAGDQIIIAAEEEIAKLSAPLLDKVYLDVSVERRGKLYPRLEFHGADDTYLFSVTGLEGAEAFLPALDSFDREEKDLKGVERPDGEPEEVEPADPALVLLNSFKESGSKIKINAIRDGLFQTWQGTVEKIMPMGGFVNVMSKPFHLHLKAGKVVSWQSENGTHMAIGHDGAPIGLEITEL